MTKIRIGNREFDTPSQSVLIAENKQDIEIVIHVETSVTSGGISNNLPISTTIDLSSLQFPNNPIIHGFNFNSQFTDSVPVPNVAYDATKHTRIFLDDVVYNIGTGNKRIQASADQVLALNGYAISLRSLNQFFVTAIIYCGDFGKTSFVAGDIFSFQCTFKLKYN